MFPFPTTPPSVIEEIEAQIEFLSRPTTKWVKSYPTNPNSACTVVRHVPASKRLRLFVIPAHTQSETVSLSSEAIRAIAETIRIRYDLPLAYYLSPMTWNDMPILIPQSAWSPAHSKQEVIGVLTETVQRLKAPPLKYPTPLPLSTISIPTVSEPDPLLVP